MKLLVFVLLAALDPMPTNDIVPNQDVEHALAALSLTADEAAHVSPENAGTAWRRLNDDLAGLEAAVRRNARIRLNRGGRPLELEAHDERLFGAAPVLPKEDKHGGSWTFKPVRFEVVPRHLFIYGLRFKGSRTLRIRWVKLIFADGEVLHSDWAAMENGNGKAFNKHTFIPYLESVAAGHPKRARALRAVEVLGSAQDRDLASALDFMITIPDPADPPYKTALNLLESYRKTWPIRRPTIANLKLCLDEIDQLASVLDIAPDAY